jgi:tRNA threonylcarbamoyladenosine biosynthesis protein TsaB
MILALDTSTHTMGLALFDGVQVVSEAVWVSRNHHTVELAPAVAETLARAGVKVPELGAIIVATGPGSFTGLRIGLALAKGMALMHQIPLVGIPTLDILAAAQPLRVEPLATILRAGRGRLAVGWYEVKEAAWQLIGNIEVCTPQELAHRIQSPTVVCGELTDGERRLLGRKRKNVILASPAQSLRRPSFLAELGWQRWQSGKTDNPTTLAPFYLHYNEPIQA